MKSRYITPSVTLFEKDGKTIDLNGMKDHFEFLIKGGVDGILIFGSIGEFFSISMEQKKKLITCAVKTINKKVKLLVGTTSMEKEETIELSRYANQEGADAVIILPPYYFPLSDKFVENYYDGLADELSDQEMYLYNFPDRTGYSISVPVVERLLKKHKNIVGIKDTQAGMANTIDLIKKIKPQYPDFEIYSGFDDNFAHNVLSGGDGCIAGLSNIAPHLCHAWVQAFEEENLLKVSNIQQTINGLMEIYQVGVPFVPYIKAAMIENGQKLESRSVFPFMEAEKIEKQALADILAKWL